MRGIRIALLILFVFLSVISFGVQLQEIEGVRATAMGDAYSALAYGTEAIVYNPAGLGQDKKLFHLAGNGSTEFNGLLYNGFIGTYMNFGILSLGLAAISTTATSLGSGNLATNFMDSVFIGSAALDFFDFLYIGGNVKYYLTTLGDTTALSDSSPRPGTPKSLMGQGIGFDVGLLIRFWNVLSVSGFVKNIFTNIYWANDKYIEQIPRDVIVGIKLQPANNLRYTFDLKGGDRGDFTVLNMGFEWDVVDFFHIRFGYKGLNLGEIFNYGSRELYSSYTPDKRYFGGYPTAGIGIDIDGISINYAYMMHPAGDMHRLGMEIGF